MQNRATSLTARPIDDALYGLMREHRYVHVLIDRLQGNPLDDMFAALPPQQAPTTIALKDPIFSDAPDKSPAIVTLDHRKAGDAEILSQTVQLALDESTSDASRSICAWLFSQAPADRLAAALSQRLDVHYPKGKRIYLRYFDPRVMPRLQCLLKAEASSQLLAPVHTWCMLGRHGEWVQIQTPEPMQAPHALHAPQALADAIDRIELINGAARLAAAAGHQLPHDSDAELDLALLEACAQGLTDTEQQMSFAALSICFGRHFTDHPSRPEWIRLAQESGLPLNEIVKPSLMADLKH